MCIAHARSYLGKLVRYAKRIVCRPPVVETDILLISPFDERRAVGEALMKSAIGEDAGFAGAAGDADAGLVAIPLGKKRSSPVLFHSLRGFQEEDADEARGVIGLTQTQTQPLEHAFVDRLRLATSVCVVCLNLAVTPFPHDALAADMPRLRQKFGTRLIFVGINGETLRAWNPESRCTRWQKWRELIGSTDFIECSLNATGISDVNSGSQYCCE